MYMTDYEIAASYREAKHPRNQISVLADLNAVTREAMETKLRSLGFKIDEARRRGGRPRVINSAVVMVLIGQGLTDGEIALQLGVARNTVTAWRKRAGVKKGTEHA